MGRWTVGDIQVLQVEEPGWEMVLPQDDASVAALQRSPWLQPHFVTDDWSLRIGSSAVVLRRGDDVVLVDPFLAFDDPDALGRRLQALRDAGVEAEHVVAVVYTHVDGVGVGLLADRAPTFPDARYLVPRLELEALRAGDHGDPRGEPLLALWDGGTVVPTTGDERLLDGVRLDDAPGHNPGHHVVWIEAGDESAVLVGHLFLHPAQIADPEVVTADRDPEVLRATRRELLAEVARRRSVLVGPLFAGPGGGRVSAAGSGWRLEVG